MPGATACQAALAEDRSRCALDFVHHLLLAADAAPQSLEDLLTEAAQAFAATGAGIAEATDGVAVPRHRTRVNGTAPASCRWPWEEQPDLLARVRNAAVAVPVQTDQGHLLATAVCQPRGAVWFLWLEAPPTRVWTEAEAAALALVGQVLARQALCDAETPRWVRQLDQAGQQQWLEEMARVIGLLAHDFSNVLTGILGFAELTLTQLTKTSPVHTYIKDIYFAAQKGNQLIRQLRLFSRRGPIQALPTSFAAVAEQEAMRVRQAWPPDVRLQLDVPADAPLAAIDADSLCLVLSHVLENAREAMTGAGLVTLSARATHLAPDVCWDLLGNATAGPHLEITVTDTGRGLSAEVRRRLFREVFFSTKLRHRGLGLAVVYGILFTHRGGFCLEAGPEGGTVVRLFVPAAVPAPSVATVAQANVSARDDHRTFSLPTKQNL